MAIVLHLVSGGNSERTYNSANTGVKDFLLVDPDVFLPGNVTRHELDWRNVGAHKVDAIKQRLELITPGVSVETAKASLGGQESSSFLSSILGRLGQCDIIVDATADVRVFNLLAAVARRFAKSMVWMEVYAGGIGGFVGRSRPGIDSDPHLMRRHYLAYADEHSDKGLPVTLENYGALSDDGTPLQATDADVAVIAGHVTRLILDTLIEGPSSIFPYSMYLIGLQTHFVNPRHSGCLRCGRFRLFNASTSDVAQVVIFVVKTTILPNSVNHELG